MLKKFLCLGLLIASCPYANAMMGAEEYKRAYGRHPGVNPQESDEVQKDVDDIKLKLSRYLQDNKQGIDLSKDEDVALFIGNTGAGKSSLIAYLANIMLNFNGEDIEIRDPNGTQVKIGDGDQSVTTFPVPVRCADNNLILYDLPGLRDSRGLPYDLLTAALIKNIAEKAKSVRFVFVESYGSIVEGGRGELFKDLIKKSKSVFKITPKSSAFVITRTPNELRQNRIDNINALVGPEFMRENGKTFLERKRGIDAADKQPILNAIYALQGVQYDERYSPLNVSQLYSADARLRLNLIMKQTKDEALSVFNIQIPHFNTSHEVINFTSTLNLMNAFKQKIYFSPLIQIVQPLTDTKVDSWGIDAIDKNNALINLLKNKQSALEQKELTQKMDSMKIAHERLEQQRQQEIEAQRQLTAQIQRQYEQKQQEIEAQNKRFLEMQSQQNQQQRALEEFKQRQNQKEEELHRREREKARKENEKAIKKRDQFYEELKEGARKKRDKYYAELKKDNQKKADKYRKELEADRYSKSRALEKSQAYYAKEREKALEKRDGYYEQLRKEAHKKADKLFPIPYSESSSELSVDGDY